MDGNVADHPDISSSMNQLGNVLFGKSKYEETLEWYQQSLAMNKMILGNSSLKMLHMLKATAKMH